jgi:hypothetical protein
MNTHTLAVVCAVLGVAFSVVYALLGVSAVKLLREMRDHITRS